MAAGRDDPDVDGDVERGAESNRETSPWATDQIPPATAEVVWDEPVKSRLGTPRPSTGHTDAVADATDAPDDAGSRTRRRWLWTAAVGGVALVAAIVIWPGGADETAGDLTGDRGPDEAADSAPDLGTLPDPDPDPDRDADDDENEEDENEGDDGDESSVDDAGDTADPQSAAAQTVSSIELPDAVTAIDQPTEVVVLTSTGALHTLSLPSGTVRTTELGPSGGAASLSVSPDASLIAMFERGDPIIVPRAGAPIELDRDDFVLDDGDTVSNLQGYGWAEGSDGSTSILAVGYVNNSNSRGSFLIGADGSVSADATESSDANFGFFIESPGVRVVNDAGGVYRVGIDGSSTRISDGVAVASSAERTLVRECDESRQCRYVLLTFDGSDPTPIADQATAALDEAGFGSTLSPDGSAASYPLYWDGQERVVIDLVTGETSSVDLSDVGFGNSVAWAPDGSGMFLSGESGNGLSFLDRTTGDLVGFGDDLGQVTAVGVRYPDTEIVEEPVFSIGSISFSTDPAGEIGLDVVTVGRIGGMTLIDLDDATTTTWDTPAVSGNPPPQLFSDGSQVLAVSGRGSRAYLAEFGSASELDGAAMLEPPFLPGPGGSVWARSPDAAFDVDSVLIGLDGAELSPGESVVLNDATLLGGDGTGGLVVATGGDVYVSTGGGAADSSTGLNRLTTGELLAIGTMHALVRECDANRSCTTSVLDRSTGESAVIEGSPAGADAVNDARDASLVGSMSPDGQVVLAEFRSVGTGTDPPTIAEKWALFDLVSGSATSVIEPSQGQPIVWNADSSYAAFVADDRLYLYERSTASVIEVTGTSDVRALTEVDEAFGDVGPAGAEPDQS